MSKPKLTLVKDMQAYFKDLVTDALERQRIKAGAHTEYYLVNLLTQFLHVDNLYDRDKDSGELRDEALASILKAATEAADHLNRHKSLKRLGDVSLYTAGFFSESLSRKTVDVDYYIDMGKAAYGNLSSIIPDQDFSKLFAELSERFDKFVDVLNEISEMTTSSQTPQDILRMYEMWLKTRSGRAEQKLKDAGIIPAPVPKKNGSKQ